jgi:hypothetical protein
MRLVAPFGVGWPSGLAGHRMFAIMALIMLFLLGIVNFAMHKAVLSSGHPLLARTAWSMHMLRGQGSLVIEFLMLLGAMLMVDQGSVGWAFGYAIYTVINAFSAWLILSNRI